MSTPPARRAPPDPVYALAMARRFSTFVAQTLHYFTRPHTHIPTAPLESPAAWRVADLDERDWLHPLDASAIDEIEAAIAHALTRGPLDALTRADFPLPTLEPRIAEWQRTLSDGRGFQVIRGLPVHRWTHAEARCFFWGLGQHLGLPGAQNAANDLLGDVIDTGADPAAPDVRGYQTASHLAFHCDAADAVGLLCLRPALEGGRSLLVSSVTILNTLLEQAPEHAHRLFAPFALDTHAEGGLRYIPIEPCRFAGGRLHTFYHGDYFRTSTRYPGVSLSPADHACLDAVDAIAADPRNCLTMDFEAGDIQLVSNHTVLHSRTHYRDAPDAKRHLLRLWLTLPGDDGLRWRRWLTQVGLMRRLVVERIRQSRLR